MQARPYIHFRWQQSGAVGWHGHDFLVHATLLHPDLAILTVYAKACLHAPSKWLLVLIAPCSTYHQAAHTALGKPHLQMRT
jgi:hypothetical protein